MINKKQYFISITILVYSFIFTQNVFSDALYKEGVDYITLKNPIKTQIKAPQIEVIEFFWYGCPHCYSFAQGAQNWKNDLPKLVHVTKVPAFFGSGIWKTHARLYYTLQAMNLGSKASLKVFNEVQHNRNNLNNIDKMAAFVKTAFKVDKKKFKTVYSSFGVTRDLTQAYSIVKSYKLHSVPAIAIGGHYLITSGLAQNPDRTLNIVKFLVHKINNKKEAKLLPARTDKKIK